MRQGFWIGGLQAKSGRMKISIWPAKKKKKLAHSLTIIVMYCPVLNDLGSSPLPPTLLIAPSRASEILILSGFLLPANVLSLAPEIPGINKYNVKNYLHNSLYFQEDSKIQTDKGCFFCKRKIRLTEAIKISNIYMMSSDLRDKSYSVTNFY